MNRTIILACFWLVTAFVSAQSRYSENLFEFKVNGKWGLSNVAGKTVVKPEYSAILFYNDNCFVAKKNDNRISLYNIKGKTVFTFTCKDVSVEVAGNGAMLFRDSNTVHLFNKNLDQIETYHTKTELTDYPGFFTIFKEANSQASIGELDLFDKETHRIMKLNMRKASGEDYDEWKGSKKNCFTFTHLDSDNSEIFLLVDENGRKIFDMKMPPGKIEEWYKTKSDSLFKVEDDRLMKSIIDQHYSNSFKKESLSQLTMLTKSDSAGKEKFAFYKLDGSLVIGFPAGADISGKKFEEQVRHEEKEISHFEVSFAVTGAESKDFLLNKKLELKGELKMPDEDKAGFEDAWMDKPVDGKIAYCQSGKIHLYDLRADKDLLVFTPGTDLVYNTRDLVPISPIEGTKNSIIYKEGFDFGILDLKSGTKTKLFTTPSSFETLSDLSVDVRALTGKIKINLVSDEKNGKTSSMEKSFIRRSENVFKDMSNYRVENVFPLAAYDTLNPVDLSYHLPFYKCTSKINKDSIIIMDYKGSKLADLNGKILYWLGETHLAASDGVKTDIFDLKFKVIEKGINSVVCAAVDNNPGELIIFEKGDYYLKKGKTIKKLFSENELNCWPLNFRNNIDSNDYKVSGIIIHAQRKKNLMIIYQFFGDESNIKISVYNNDDGRLHTDQEVVYQNTINDVESNEDLIKNRFSFIRKTSVGLPKYSPLYNPVFITDTLYLSEENEFTSSLSDKYKNYHLFYGKNDSRTYLGTIDRIQYSFESYNGSGHWDQDVYYIGDPDRDFRLIDPVKKEILPKKYKEIRLDEEGNDYHSFMVRDENGNSDFFTSDSRGYKKIMSGKFHSFTSYRSWPDALGRRRDYYAFFDKSGSIMFYTDDKFKLLYDTSGYTLAEGADASSLWDGDGNYLILQSRKRPGEWHLFNAITGKFTLLKSKVMDTEDYGRYHLILSGNEGSKDIILVVTGDVIKNIDSDKVSEYFVRNGKLYYSVESDDGNSLNVFDSKGRKLK